MEQKKILQIKLFLEEIKYYEEEIYLIILNLIFPKFKINDTCFYKRTQFDCVLKKRALIYGMKYTNKNELIYIIKYHRDGYWDENNPDYNSSYKEVSKYDLC